MKKLFCAALGGLVLTGSATASEAESGNFESTSIAEFEQHIQPFLQEHCVRCHGEKKRKADFTVDDIDGVISAGKDIVRWEKILEMVSLGDMPPEDEDQPDKLQRARVEGWIAAELRKIGRGHNEGKLALPHQANRLDHEELFSGVHKGPAYSPARLWRKNEYIYSKFANEMRTQVSQPFMGLGGKGIQDYATLVADESTISTMLRNANLIAENLTTAEKARFRNLFNGEGEPDDEEVERSIRDLFKMIFNREPTDGDREYYIAGLFEKNREIGGLEKGFKTLIMGMVLSQEFVFRLELGLGEKLPDGRRMLNPQELAYAISFAFYDKPDESLLRAASDGKLATREDVEREVRRLLAQPDEQKQYWAYPMYHRWGEDYYRHSPRLLRFFQEFFGYAAAPDVFKDKSRNGDHHALRLRKDADMFVLHILERDKDVLKELLTSNKYPFDYLREDKLAKALEGNKRWSDHLKNHFSEKEIEDLAKAGKWPGVDTRHVSAYNISKEEADDIRRAKGEIVALPKDERAGMLTHPAWLVAHSGNFDNDPIRRGKWIREHLLADMVPDVPIGVDAKVPEDPHRTLKERLDIVRKEECWRCHKKMNPLGEAFEAYDDFGRYREEILLGDAETYLKEKGRYDSQKENWEKDLQKWLDSDAKARAEKVRFAKEMLAGLKKPEKGVENYPAQLKHYEGDVQRWTKERDYWSRITDEEQQRIIADLRKRLSELVEPEGEFKPVDASGSLDGTGDPRLDGPVQDGVELAHKLAGSELVRQSFIRHAFRYWMGRNETLDDSPTLIAADRAYVEGGGSFKEMLVSLLTSDSFLYRK